MVSSILWAEVTDIITLRNGNTYSGFIWMQLSNGEIGFKADTSIVYLPAAEIERIERHPVRKGDKRQMADIYLYSACDSTVVLDSVAVIEEEPIEVIVDSVYAPEVAYVDSVAYPIEEIVIESVPAVQEVIRGVELLEEGSIIKYRDTNPADLKLNMKDIRLISRPQRDPALLNGLLDEISTKSGQTYKGTIVSTEPGKSVKLNSDGRIYSILLSDIDAQRKVAVDPDEPLFVQSPVIDNVYLRDGKGVLLDVVLIEQNYFRGTFDVIDRNNVVTRRPLSEINKIRKTLNLDYKPRREFAFNIDSLYINREGVDEMPYERKNGKIRLKIEDASSIKTFARTHGCISVEGFDNTASRRMLLISLGASLSKRISISIFRSLSRRISPCSHRTLIRVAAFSAVTIPCAPVIML